MQGGVLFSFLSSDTQPKICDSLFLS